MSARANILARIRAAQGKPALAEAAEQQVVRAHLDSRVLSPRPRSPGDPRAEFRARALALASTLAEVANVGDVPRAVSGYLKGSALPVAAVCWPEFAALDWRAAGLHVDSRGARNDDLVGITGAFCAIAETGTLMLVTGADTPASTSLLPETHIALVRAERIVPHMEEAWRLLRRERADWPRAVNFVSGPSRTADIEQTVTLGAHGPYRVHIIVITGG
ncbi:MAG: LutC/YkgG family protein [Betaproteobacteria bacterium]